MIPAKKSKAQSSDYSKYLCCPSCKQSLSRNAQGYHCVSCQQDFPMVDDTIAVLFAQPERFIAYAYYQLYKTLKQWDQQSATLSKALKSSNRKKNLLPILKAQHDNKDFFQRWAEILEKQVSAPKLLDVQNDTITNSYGYNYNYLIRDWCNQPQGNQEVNSVLNSLWRCLRLVPDRGRACMLGMGTGRFGLELCNYFEDIWGIDSSFGQIAQYFELQRRDINFWQIMSKNKLHHANFTKKMTAMIPKRLKNKASHINYLWADALNSPFVDGFFDWVFSIYFSDVKPLPELIKEVKRILRPGGYFLHCGPLEYHFKQIEHHYAFDEFKTYFIENGFEVVHESTSQHPVVVPKVATALITPSQYLDKVLLLKLT